MSSWICLLGKEPVLPDQSSATRVNSRLGFSRYLLMAFLGSVIMMFTLGWGALRLRTDAARNDQVTENVVRIYCAAGAASPVQEVVDQYNRDYDQQVEVARTGGSGELIGQIKTEFETGLLGGADVYLSADENLMNRAHQEGVVASRFVVAEQKPVIAVRANFSTDIRSLKDLVSNDSLKFGVASKRAAIGRLVRKIGERDGILNLLEERKKLDSENVMTLAQALATGSIDAAVIWNTTVTQINQSVDGRGKLVKISAYAGNLNQDASNLTAGLIGSSQNSTAALKFCRYLAESQEAKETFGQYGYDIVIGDDSAEASEVQPNQ